MVAPRYIWDVRHDSYLMEKDGAGATTAVYSNEPVPYGRLISQRRSAETSYHHFDGQESTRELTDNNENVTDTGTYTAFGQEVTKTGTTENPLAYKGALGYYTDAGTGDIYVRRRQFQVQTGRWFVLDPLGFLDGTNRYAYAFNNPLSLTDLEGTQAEASNMPPCCCCRPLTLRITDIKRVWEIITPRGQRPKAARFGHSYNVFGLLAYELEPGGDCTLEWWEYSTIPIKNRFGDDLEPNEWTDLFPGHIRRNPAFAGWIKRLKPCPGLESVVIPDKPSIVVFEHQAKQRVLYIVIRLRGGCLINPGEQQVWLEQRLGWDPITNRRDPWLLRETGPTDNFPPGLPPDIFPPGIIPPTLPR